MLTSIALALLIAQAPVTVPGSAGQTTATSPAQVSSEKPWPPSGVARVGAGVAAPRLLKDVKPKYTADARSANVQGSVGMEVVVKTDGSVGDVRVQRSLDREYGLDDEAVRAVKQWRFAAGTKDGVAVPVLVEVEMTFALRK